MNNEINQGNLGNVNTGLTGGLTDVFNTPPAGICPGCGRCRQCGQPNIQPMYPAPFTWPNTFPYTPPTFFPTPQTSYTFGSTTCGIQGHQSNQSAEQDH